MTPHTEKEYFWKDFEQVYQDEWVGKRLLTGEEVPLESIKMGFYLSPKHIDDVNNMTEEERFDFFLDFLLGVLKNKELKVGRMKTYEKNEIIPPEDIKEGMPIIIDYTGTPEEIVARLKKEWNECIDEVNKNKTSYEIDIVFTLSENPWLKYIN